MYGTIKLPDGLKEQLAGIADALTGKISVIGTFSPAALFGLGGGDTVEHTSRNTAQIARHTQRLTKAAVTNRLTFA